jgi:hypothetical protein
MKRIVPFALALLLAGPALAQPSAPVDSAAAREQLKVGFKLKQKGDFVGALGHLEESVRLDPKQPKALINLADCEEHVGRWVAAQEHWVRARDLGSVAGMRDIEDEAKKRLSELEAKMPRLVVKIDPAAPKGIEVVRDGVVLGAVSIDTPLPTDPGKHVVVARAAGYAEQSFDVTIVEKETKTLVVHPGARLPEVAAPPVTASRPPVDKPAGPTSGSSRKTIGLVVGAVGLVGLGIGGAFGGVALSKKSAANADGHCDASGCDAEGNQLRTDAFSAARVSTIAVIGGAVALAGGVVLVLTAPSAASPKTARVVASPLAAPTFVGAQLLSVW